MNNFVGNPSRANNTDALAQTSPQGSSRYAPYQKLTALRSPSLTFVILDERENSINDGTFFTSLSGTIPAVAIADIPASYHGGAAGISFADGHAELHQWHSSRLTVPIQAAPINNLSVAGDTAGLADSYWLQQHAVGIASP